VIVLTRQFVTLNHGAHGTIENQDPLGKAIEKYFVAVNRRQKAVP